MGTLIAIIIVIAIIIIYLSISDRQIYLDNNATTPVHFGVFAVEDANSGPNKNAAEISNNAKKTLLNWVNSPDYNVIWTSGASESNNLFFRGLVDNHWLTNTNIPHVILSAIEHKTSLICVKQLARLRRVNYTLIKPGPGGAICPFKVAAAVRPNTIGISIMHSNNETGAVNDIAKMCSLTKGIPFHCDIVQSVGKLGIPLSCWGISAASISFHKLYGPCGLGALIVHPDLKLSPQISGTQNNGLRGGTENIAAIAGADYAMKITFSDREEKNARLLRMKQYILSFIYSNYMFMEATDFYGKPDTYNPVGDGIVAVILTPPESTPNTLFISFVKLGPLNNHLCNINIKNRLEKKNIIIGIGSACNSASTEPNHVLMALGMPYCIRCGVLRISLGDYNTESDCKRLCNALKELIV